MAIIPVIPENIVVHLGPPDSDAENVTVPFAEYIKNVASSEIFSTWPESAIRANILAQISFALNRIYTEWYRAKGYDFDITSVTQYDQKFIKDRNIYENIDRIVNEIFNDYLRKQGTVNPFFAQYCNGTTVTCEGLSQWGTVDLAEQGLDSIQIIRNYYGDNTELVVNAPIAENVPSFPDKPLERGDLSENVRRMQIYLNRISKNYPAIPKIPEVVGSFGESTEDAVREFQDIFNLPITGKIDKATWYKIIFIYDSVTKLAELNSEGVKYEDLPKQYTEPLRLGMSGGQVISLQYFLQIVSEFNNSIPDIEITGFFDETTQRAVEAFQLEKGLPVTGVVNKATWDALYDAFQGAINLISDEVAPVQTEPYPGVVLKRGDSGNSVKVIKGYLNFISRFLYDIPVLSDDNFFGPRTQNAVNAFQRTFELPITGQIDEQTWNTIADVYKEIRIGQERNKGQFPGYTIG